MAEINSPHDSFFKRLLGDLAVAVDFMECYLPPEILARLDLDTLRLEPESYVDPELRNHFSDLLFSVQTTASSTPVFIYLLLEHKSAPDRWVAFQLLRYIVRFWERQHAQGCKRLPLVIPLVFYHGQERWNVSRRFSALLAPENLGELSKYAVDYEYDLRDVSVKGGAELKGQPKLRAGLELMRYIFSDDLERRLTEIFGYLRAMQWTDALEYLRSLFAYLSKAREKLDKQKVRQSMENVFPDLEFNKNAIFIQEWMEEGREEGREEGVHIGVYSVTLRQLEHRVGALDEMTQEQIRALPNDKLLNLSVALLDFSHEADLQRWLNDNAVVV